MQSLYIKTKFGLKEILDTDKTAKLMKVKPSTLTAYLAREQVYLKKVRIKNLIFFYRDDVENFIKLKKEQECKKIEEKMMDLFDENKSAQL